MPNEPTFASRLNEAVDLIDAQPPNIQQKPLVITARAALEALLADIEENPGGFKGSTG